jgi:hypothetical protein
MKTICSSSTDSTKAIVQVNRNGTRRNYRPTAASWKRYISLALAQIHQGGKTYHALPAAAFKQ